MPLWLTLQRHFKQKANDTEAGTSIEDEEHREDRRGLLALLFPLLLRFETEDIGSRQFWRSWRENVYPKWEEAFRRGKRDAGCTGELTADDRAALQRMLRTQDRHLDGFFEDIRAGREKLDWYRRMTMYIDAMDQAYWEGYRRCQAEKENRLRWTLHPAEHCADCLALDGTIKPASEWTQRPRDGQTRCLTNCRCTLDEVV